MDRSSSLTTRPVAAAPAPPATAEVLGIPLALTDYDGALDWIDARRHHMPLPRSRAERGERREEASAAGIKSVLRAKNSVVPGG